MTPIGSTSSNIRRAIEFIFFTLTGSYDAGGLAHPSASSVWRSDLPGLYFLWPGPATFPLAGTRNQPLDFVEWTEGTAARGSTNAPQAARRHLGRRRGRSPQPRITLRRATTQAV